MEERPDWSPQPPSKRPLFTVGFFDGVYGEHWACERLRNIGKGPIYHGGQPVSIKSVWRDTYGAFRIGHTDDMTQMLDDLGIPDRAF